MSGAEIALLCIGVALAAGFAGFYFGWNEGAAWERVSRQLGERRGRA